MLQVTVSTIVLWSMVEAGLAVIAACLPTLRFLVGKISLDSMMNSVRSAFSLRSIHTQRSQNSTARPGGPYLDLDGSASSTKMVPKVGVTEIIAMGDIEMANPAGDSIHVTKEVSQYNSEV